MDFEYQLHLIGDRPFELLSSLISERILGIGTFVFAANKDGGRDGRFEGTAKKFPSETVPWYGKFILQSKHTTSPTARCSDGEFRKIIDLEIPNIIKLIASGELDNYIIFTNRTLTGVEEKAIRDRIEKDTKVKNNCILGKE